MQANPFIELAGQLGATWAWVLYGLLAINTLPILVVMLAGPRRWAQALALVTVQTDLYLVWIGLAAGSAGLLTDARMLPCVIPFLVLLAQVDARSRTVDLHLQSNDRGPRDHLLCSFYVTASVHDPIGFACQKQSNRTACSTGIDRFEIGV